MRISSAVRLSERLQTITSRSSLTTLLLPALLVLSDLTVPVEKVPLIPYPPMLTTLATSSCGL